LTKRETILAIDSAVLDVILRTIGVNIHPCCSLSEEKGLELMSAMEDNIWFGPREALEKNFEFRQIIPYVVVSNGTKIMIYQRSSSKGDNRLNNLWSIGLGGHVRLQDINPLMLLRIPSISVPNILVNSLKRELSEELVIPAEKIYEEQIKIIGIINMGSKYTKDVNAVHFGIVFYYENPNITIPTTTNEDDMRHFQFVNKHDVMANFNNEGNTLEDWSIAVTEILPDMSNGL
jgi:predicted NUDIX family phosphoesterase